MRKERKKTEAESNVLPYAEVGHQKVGANVSTGCDCGQACRLSVVSGNLSGRASLGQSPRLHLDLFFSLGPGVGDGSSDGLFLRARSRLRAQSLRGGGAGAREPDTDSPSDPTAESSAELLVGLSFGKQLPLKDRPIWRFKLWNLQNRTVIFYTIPDISISVFIVNNITYKGFPCLMRAVHTNMLHL